MASASYGSLLSPSGHHRFFSHSPIRSMALGLVNGRHAADEEARAEVDVLTSRLERTTQLTRKIQACLGRLEATGKSVKEVTGPLNGETRKLQKLGHSESSLLPVCRWSRAGPVTNKAGSMQTSMPCLPPLSAYANRPTAKMTRKPSFAWARTRPACPTISAPSNG